MIKKILLICALSCFMYAQTGSAFKTLDVKKQLQKYWTADTRLADDLRGLNVTYHQLKGIVNIAVEKLNRKNVKANTPSEKLPLDTDKVRACSALRDENIDEEWSKVILLNIIAGPKKRYLRYAEHDRPWLSVSPTKPEEIEEIYSAIDNLTENYLSPLQDTANNIRKFIADFRLKMLDCYELLKDYLQ